MVFLLWAVARLSVVVNLLLVYLKWTVAGLFVEVNLLLVVSLMWAVAGLPL